MLGYIYYYGAALHRLIEGPGYMNVKADQTVPSAFIVNEKFPLYLKYSTKRMSPWQFTFPENSIREVQILHDKYQRTLIGLICGEDGICALNYEEFRQLTDTELAMTKWITVSRMKREKYGVRGSGKKLKYKIGDNSFPEKVYS